jgi:hypothetical protein
VGRTIVLLLMAVVSRPLPASADTALLEPNSALRRVCVQMGVPAFETQPDESEAARSSAPRVGGGAYVVLTGRRARGYAEVRLLHGGIKWIPEQDSASGRPSLCAPQATIMRTCGEAAGGEGVPAFDEPAGAPAPAFHVPLDTRVQVWGYFPDGGRWTLIERSGRIGFMRSSSLCLVLSAPPRPDAPSRLSMRPAPANPDCYQSHRERGANEITRIVIHNSEATVERTIATFQACNPAHAASAHVGIDRDGTMYRFVDDRFAAFHTGGHDGGFNAGSLGVELMASGRRGSRGMTNRQERALLALIRDWSDKYGIVIPARILSNSSRSRAYNSVEFWDAPVTIHRLISAGRGTDCPSFVWPDSAKGDDAFFRWRKTRLR